MLYFIKRAICTCRSHISACGAYYNVLRIKETLREKEGCGRGGTSASPYIRECNRRDGTTVVSRGRSLRAWTFPRSGWRKAKRSPRPRWDNCARNTFVTLARGRSTTGVLGRNVWTRRTRATLGETLIGRPCRVHSTRT